MKRALFLLLVFFASASRAQTDYVEAPKPVKPAPEPLPAVKWSVGMDLLGPVSALWAEQFNQDHVVRYGLVAHHWTRKNNAWRMGYSFTRARREWNSSGEVVDSIREHWTDSYEDHVHAFRFGVVSMKRGRRSSPVIGLSAVFAVDKYVRSRSTSAQRLDSLSGGELYFSNILDYEGASEGYRDDLWGELGLEGAFGYGVRITEHLEMDVRFSVWFRWRFQMTSKGEDPMPDLGTADDPFRFGLVYPGIFLHYAW